MPGERAAPLWGPRLLEPGVEFRLWAPSAERVELRVALTADWHSVAMSRFEAGWWRATVDDAGPGCLYRFRIDGAREVPDPASRFQPQDCHGPSEVVDPGSHTWQAADWTGRPWHEAVVYELHLGTFTPEGTCRAAIDRLDTLVELGVTAIELMPVADFRGRHNWGYDGVLPFAPDHVYGTPSELRALVDAAHRRGLMVLLDVVYNHFGPEGNYLGTYAKPFFTHRHHTPWGDAINFDDGPEAVFIRSYFIENALYWLTDYRFDGLRLDAVHAICDDSEPHILTELAERVREGPGRERHVHLVLENDANEAHFLAADAGHRYDAQWNDDFHHVAHVIATGERDGYYEDYADAPLEWLQRVLAEGFAYQGEHSRHRGRPRGEPSARLPPSAFVSFLQNHDQVGNRALGERLHELTGEPPLRALTAILLLSPMPPLLFMGQEWCASSRFPFFCDFEGELAAAVRAGRLEEFSHFPAFSDPAARARIPDPVSADTFTAARLDWGERSKDGHRRWWEFHRDLLALRRRHVVPLLERMAAGGTAEPLGESALVVRWPLTGGGSYVLHANLSGRPLQGVELPSRRVYASAGVPEGRAAVGMPPWSVAFSLAPGARQHG